jgi:branched-chain amino acid transport system ATP-binding protein
LEQTKKAVLRVKNLSFSYGMVSALRGVNMEVGAGEFVALIGANGAGKSTFMTTVLGITRASYGSILFMGEEVTYKPTNQIVASGISLCPEGRGILPEMNVMDNLLLGAFHNRSVTDRSLSHVFHLFPILEERKGQSVGTLSGGQQQMLSIGRALMGAPKLLMLDEPSLGLAPLVVKEILEILRSLVENGQTILLSEQNVRKALQYASRAYLFETGRVVLEGLSEDLMRNEAVIEAYLGGTAPGSGR